MNAMDIQVGVQDRPTHISHKLNPKFPDILVVVLDRFQDVQEMLRDYSIRHPGSLLEPVPVLDGHDAWDNRDSDARLPNSLCPTDEEVRVKEHLGKDPRATEVDFVLEVL